MPSPRRLLLLAPVLAVAGCMANGRLGAGPSTGAEAVGRRVYFLQGEGSVKLAYARPGRVEVALLLQCRAGSGTVTVRSAAPARAGATLTLTSGVVRSDLRATPATDGAATLVYADAPATAPALQALRTGGRLQVRYGPDRYTVADRPEDRADTGKFLDACTAR